MIVGYNKPGIVVSKSLYQDNFSNDLLIYGSYNDCIDKFLTPNIYHKKSNFIVLDKKGELYNQYTKILNSFDTANKQYNVQNLNFNNKNSKIHYNPVKFAQNDLEIALLAKFIILSFKYTATQPIDKEQLHEAMLDILTSVLLYVRFIEPNENQNLKTVASLMQNITKQNNDYYNKIHQLIIDKNYYNHYNIITNLTLFQTLPIVVQKEAVYQVMTALTNLSQMPYYEQINGINNIDMQNFINNDSALFITPHKLDNAQGLSISNILLCQIYNNRLITQPASIKSLESLLKLTMPNMLQCYKYISLVMVDISKNDLSQMFQNFLDKEIYPMSIQYLTSDDTLVKELYNKTSISVFLQQYPLIKETDTIDFSTYNYILAKSNELSETKVIIDEYYNYKKHPNYNNQLNTSLDIDKTNLKNANSTNDSNLNIISNQIQAETNINNIILKSKDLVKSTNDKKNIDCEKWGFQYNYDN